MAKFLIVDDSILFRKKLIKLITNAGYEVAGEAEDGNIGFEKYKELKPDAVLLDITMPNCNGVEALQLIKDYDKNAKVIMITAVEEKAILIKAMQIGSLDYIIKPFNEERVLNSLRKVVNI